MRELTVGSLFAGIGGFDLGLERAGMRTLWFCEQDPFCRRVLARHWPGVPCYPDVRRLSGIPDPAQFYASIPKRITEEDQLRWLEGEIAAADRESDVRALVADAGRLGGPVGREAGDVDGAPRGGQGEGPQRQRDGDAAHDRGADGPDGLAHGGQVPVPVPYVDVLCGGFPCQDISVAGRGAGLAGERSGLWREFARLIGELRPRYVLVENVPALTSRGLDVVLADLAACGFDAEWDHLPASAFGAPHRRDRIWLVAYPEGERREWALGEGGGRGESAQPVGHGGADQSVAHTDGMAGASGGACEGGREALSRPGAQQRTVGCGGRSGCPWLTEPDVGRVAHGIPARVDRLRALGNALVPQVAEWIGRRIIEWEALT